MTLPNGSQLHRGLTLPGKMRRVAERLLHEPRLFSRHKSNITSILAPLLHNKAVLYLSFVPFVRAPCCKT